MIIGIIETCLIKENISRQLGRCLDELSARIIREPSMTTAEIRDMHHKIEEKFSNIVQEKTVLDVIRAVASNILTAFFLDGNFPFEDVVGAWNNAHALGFDHPGHKWTLQIIFARYCIKRGLYEEALKELLVTRQEIESTLKNKNWKMLREEKKLVDSLIQKAKSDRNFSSGK